MKKHHAKGHTRKHAHATAKHHHHLKHHPVHHHKTATAHGHHVHTKAKHPHHAKAKGLALVPGDVACCVSEALAASLRLQGLPVSGADVLALHRAAGADDERGAPVLAVLEAAAEFGLASWRLCGFTAVASDEFARLAEVDIRDTVSGEQRVAARTIRADLEPAQYPHGRNGAPPVHPVGMGIGRVGGAEGQELRVVVDEEYDRFGLAQAVISSPGEAQQAVPLDGYRFGASPATRVGPVVFREVRHPLIIRASLILGIDLPGQHTVLATPEGWWSWGELYCPCEFPDAVIEEAWAISWKVAKPPAFMTVFNPQQVRAVAA